jgi:hypothetical protein
MQDADKSDLDSQMLGVAGELGKGFSSGAKQNVIKDPLIPQGKRIEFCRDGKDHMEVWHWKNIFSSLLNPFFFLEELALRAMPVPA